MSYAKEVSIPPTDAESMEWIRTKLGLPADSRMFSGDKSIAGALHVMCAHANGYVRYIESFKCEDKQGEIARLSVANETLTTQLAASTAECERLRREIENRDVEFVDGVLTKFEVPSQQADFTLRPYQRIQILGMRAVVAEKQLAALRTSHEADRAAIVQLARDHYWDSLEPHKDMIVLHLAALAALAAQISDNKESQ